MIKVISYAGIGKNKVTLHFRDVRTETGFDQLEISKYDWKEMGSPLPGERISIVMKVDPAEGSVS